MLALLATAAAAAAAGVDTAIAAPALKAALAGSYASQAGSLEYWGADFCYERTGMTSCFGNNPKVSELLPAQRPPGGLRSPTCPAALPADRCLSRVVAVRRGAYGAAAEREEVRRLPVQEAVRRRLQGDGELRL